MSFDRRLLFCAALSLGYALAVSPAAGQFPAPSERTSMATDGGLADESSRLPSLSDDGRFIAFASDATNVVSGDTNGNRDVFVYDTLSGVTERVSLSWKGLEARGHSDCPSISADGRYVAFLSDAWNLYRDALNFGDSVDQVYVRDRLLGTTTRLTVAHDGGDPDNPSGCPSISADGQRVAFSSGARNLLPIDVGQVWDVFVWDAAEGISLVTVQTQPQYEDGGWNPALSADGYVIAFDGRFGRVLVRDLRRDEVVYEFIEIGRDTRISDDGRYVSYRRRIFERPRPWDAVFLHDRETKTTTLATTRRNGLACGSPEARFPCRVGHVRSHDLSGDGRYVVYSTEGTDVLPATVLSGDQIYAYDRVTGRTRRLGLTPDGRMGDGCSVEPAISGDGHLIAYRTNANDVAPGRAKPIHDIVHSRWQCLDEETCRLASTCAPAPLNCAPAKSARLRLRRHAPGGTHPDRLSFRWQADPLDEPFPHPNDGATYQLCLYAGDTPEVEMDVVAGPDGKLRDGDRGWRLRSPGVTALIARNGDKRARLTFRGDGPRIDAPYLPLIAPGGLTAQIHDTNSGRCFGAHFPPETIRRNQPGEARDGRFPDGRLAADLRP